MYYTLEKTAEILELQPGEVNRLREQGALRAFRDGANWKFRKEDVENYLKQMIRERSNAKSEDSLLTSEDDEEGPTMLADSNAFDSMFDLAVENDNFVVDRQASSSNDDLTLLPEEEEKDGLSLVKDELAIEPQVDELTLAPEDVAAAKSDVQIDNELNLDVDSGSGLTLSKEEDDDFVLESDEAKDADPMKTAAPQAEEVVATSEAKFDDPLNVDIDSGSGLSLGKDDEMDDDFILDEDSHSLTDEASALVEDVVEAPATTSSTVDLGSEDANRSSDDLLHLGSDSGLALLDDVGGANSNIQLDGDDLVLGGSGSGSGSGLNLASDSGLALLGESDADFTLEDAVEEKQDEDDGGIFELQEEPQSVGNILNIDKNADPEGATELAQPDESIFELADETISDQTAPSVSSSASDDESQLVDLDESTSIFETEVSDNGAASAGASSPFSFDGQDSVSSPFSLDKTDSAADPFGSSTSMSSPFGDGLDSSFGSPVDSGAPAEIDFAPTSESEPIAASRPAVSSTNYTGKDLIILIPCLILVILATISAYELCRTIWSFEECSFSLGAPILDTIAGIIKL